MWRFLGTVLIIACYTAGTADAQRRKAAAPEEQDNKKPVAVIPFRYVDKHMVIPVVLSGSTDTLQFVFDTGAEVTVLHTRIADKLRLNKSRDAFMTGTNNAMIKVPVITLNAIYIKDLRLPYVGAYLENLDNLGQVDGVIGVALLKTYIIKIDYRQQQLVFYGKGKTPIGNTGRLLHFQLNYSTPVIDAAITLPDGRSLPGHYHITTGGDYGILFNWPYVDKNKLNTLLPTINTDQVRDMVRLLYYINSNVSELQLGGHSIKNVPVSYCKDVDDVGAFTEIAGSIGYEVWKQFSLTINYNKKELYLE
ncbi:MAG TPA: retropepsin-like aspartic protease [Chitinophaga sp.]|uniref:retropepsin-like aspartic protease n=1 Tax=Chitinophaga sp. TaxID=1869181 RepID=UPI002BDE8A73|nr:retropepsin-like aspartic protease [Chitinophaga sp.]HVI48921.1 retropepsin-like aspartic protease [Chitinophaga sp.]